MAKGGARKGAGRKKAQHTIKTEKSREYFINRISAELDPIITAQIEASKGMWFEEVNAKGERIRVYKKGPSLQTGEFLLNHFAGKAREAIELTGKDGKELKPTVIFIPKDVEKEVD